MAAWWIMGKIQGMVSNLSLVKIKTAQSTKHDRTGWTVVMTYEEKRNLDYGRGILLKYEHGILGHRLEKTRKL